MLRLKFLLLCVLFTLTTCKTRSPRERAYKKPYHREDNDLAAQLFLYHGLNNTSFLYYKINNSQLLYKKIDTNNYFSSRIRISYKFLPEAGAKQVLDSGTVFIEDKSMAQPQEKNLTGYLPFTVKDGQDSYLELFIQDAFGKRSQTHYIHCDKQNAYSQQSFLFLDQNKNVLFTNKIEKGSNITVCNSRVGFLKARIDFFANDNSLPPPPFSQKEPMLYPSIPDSTFYAQSFGEHNFSFKIDRQGVYFIRLDSSNAGGCLLLGVEQNFPKVQSHAQMIASSRFIMSKDEYQKLIDATDKQSAIEAFWLGLAGNQDRARTLIKHYYNRVQEANRFFTSHIEGWKTDMGMIYIIFGSPDNTYKTVGMETWVYGREGTPNSVTFRFEKINNPFSENCFKLQRNLLFRDPWYIAVQNWRDGRVNMED
ncbi:MAG TPA: GWxTD domain-containing protein [Bacteroidia bacterium]|jgi:GWxTD domain-containing protein|nr:GWxTD domain-containing protein [Bacteroidia bacterium]